MSDRASAPSENRTRFVPFWWLASTLLAVAQPALATPIALSITGSVTSISDPDSALDGSVTVGAPFTGLVSYETPGMAQRGGTSFPTPPAVISLEVGSLLVSSGPPSTGQLVITVLDGTYFGVSYQEPDQPAGEGGDWIGFRIALPASNGPLVQSLRFEFVDPSGQAVFDPSVPTGPLDLDLLTGSLRLSASGVGGPTFVVHGTVDSVALVPEPSTALLVAGGLALLYAARAPLNAASPRRPRAGASARSSRGSSA
jgi:hypothetical protein